MLPHNIYIIISLILIIVLYFYYIIPILNSFTLIIYHPISTQIMNLITIALILIISKISISS
jgi:hypothetical protein